jgi:thiamine biosynthesis lipoprotein
MGSEFKLTLCLENKDSLSKAFKIALDEIDRVEQLISSWINTSSISKINQASGVSPVSIPEELYQLLKFSKEIHSLTQGAYDLTIKPALNIWDWRSGVIPSKNQLSIAKNLVGFKNVIFNDSTLSVFLPKKGMSLDLGGIGKGYASWKVAETWREAGVKSGVINAGGDLYVFGNACSSKSWDVSIRNPFKKNEIIYTVKQTDISIATSGDYERFFEIDSVRYSHILNPKTCKPVKRVTSVTVFAENPTLADALATSLSVMGVNAGLDLINQIEGVEAIVIQSDGVVFLSNKLKYK